MKINDKTKGVIGTIMFHAAILLCFIFLFGFSTPLPLPGDQGVEIGTEVNLGNSDQGFGYIQPLELAENAKNVKKQSSDGSTLSQNSDDAPKINNTSENPSDNEKKQQTINQKALYTGKNKTSSNQGVAGGIGDQGNPNGKLNSKNYVGPPGTGGIDGFDLKGRKYMYLQTFKNPTDEEGKVVVSITVDKVGNVTKAVAGAKGTTCSNQILWKSCQKAALQSKFDANPDAAPEQKGTITYIFLKLN